MTEKLSHNEFDANFEAVLKRFDAAVEKSPHKKEDIILLAAIKTVDANTVNYAISKGISHIGENKVQELLLKDDDIVGAHRHFIGHLQTNKVKYIIDRVEMIESVDSVKLAKEISKQAKKHDKVMDILLEVNIGDEESKWGFNEDEVTAALTEISKFENIKIRGLMAIPPICNSAEENRKYFQKMYKLFIDISHKKIDNSNIDILSMGMSDDFDVAIEEGATLVRLGTALFGKRNYN